MKLERLRELEGKRSHPTNWNAGSYEDLALISALMEIAPALLELWGAAKNAIKNEGWYSENVTLAIKALEEAP